MLSCASLHVFNQFLSLRDGPSLQKVSESDLVPFGSAREAVLKALVDSIDERFDGDLKLIRGSSILKLKQWPKIDEGRFIWNKNHKHKDIYLYLFFQLFVLNILSFEC
jgi:hypothetical protein